jgi:predicted CXXCH cytochrome family protein
MRFRFFSILTLAAATLLVTGGGPRTSILGSRHNLSTSGPGEIKSLSETRVCIFCHSSHNASGEGPLWNHQTSTPAAFKVYTRSTLSAMPDQPNGATKLCLSCHDGTIAVGAIRGVGRPIPMQGVGASGEIPSTRRSHIGTDLTGTHPVSIRFRQESAASSTNLRWPPNDPENRVGTDADGFVQCTACHDPHGSASQRYPFWQKESFLEVCQVCHAF